MRNTLVIQLLAWAIALAVGSVAALFASIAVFRASPECDVTLLLGVVLVPLGIVELQRRIVDALRARNQPSLPRARSL